MVDNSYDIDVEVILEKSIRKSIEERRKTYISKKRQLRLINKKLITTYTRLYREELEIVLKHIVLDMVRIYYKLRKISNTLNEDNYLIIDSFKIIVDRNNGVNIYLYTGKQVELEDRELFRYFIIKFLEEIKDILYNPLRKYSVLNPSNAKLRGELNTYYQLMDSLITLYENRKPLFEAYLNIKL